MTSSSKYSTSNFFPPQPVNRILLAFLLGLGSVAQAGGLTDLGVLSGTTGSQGYAINAAGDVVVGGTAPVDSRTASGIASSSGRAFRWTATGGMTDLGTFPGGLYSIANQTNASGDVVVGWGAVGGSGNAIRAFRWTQATGMVSLGGLNGGTDGQAFGVNAAGDVVVGGAQDAAAGNTRAFRWTPAGMVGLGVLTGGTFSIAYATNAAGNVVVGLSTDGTGGNLQRGFRWTQATGMVSLGLLNGGINSFARAVNAAGDVVVGAAADGASGNADRAFRWTQASGMVSLGVLNGGTYSRGYGVDSSGNVIVGRATDGNAANASRGFRWTQATGMQSIESWLSANDVTVNPAAAKTAVAFGTNADGSVVVGILDNNHAFLASVKSAGTASGMIDLPQYNQSLDSAAGAPTVAVQDADMAMHGAHGSPMRGLLPAGGQSFTVAGDVGRGDASPLKSDMGTAEISYGRGLTENTMVKLSLGRTSSGAAQVQALASAIASSKSSVDSNKIGFRVGSRINIDVLNAEQQLYTAERDWHKARAETLIQGLRLKAANATLAEADLDAINNMLETGPQP